MSLSHVFDEEKSTEKPPGAIIPQGLSGYWETGKVLPGNYTVIRRLGRGGMGTVYLVERVPSVRPERFAVKTLIPSIADDAVKRRVFLRELRTWMDLPNHPNIVSCLFFRTIENKLAIFSEYVEGASLESWIRSHHNAPPEILLDLAIQIAWGLYCAHQCDVIHQDIKSSNIMITSDGIAKITDFGLARNRFERFSSSRQETDIPSADATETMPISVDGMTRAYCSIEQATCKRVTRRSDQWSYGLTVLEMFNGGMNWLSGLVAPLLLDVYLQRGPIQPMPAMPDGVRNILMRCFKENPSERFRSMKTIADALRRVYRKVTGLPYPREMPPLDDYVYESYGSGVNRRTSDGVKWTNPAEEIKRFMEVTGTSEEAGIRLLTESARSSKTGVLHDIGLFEQIEAAYKNLIGAGRSDLAFSLARVLYNKALATEACHDYVFAADCYRNASEWIGTPENRKEKELFAEIHLNLAACKYYTGDWAASLKTIDVAIDAFKTLVAERFEPEHAARLATGYMNRAVVLNNRSLFTEALVCLEQAIAIGEDLILEHRSDYIWNIMGFIYSAFATSLFELNQLERALDIATQAIDIFQIQLDKHNSYETAFCLGYLYILRGRLSRRNRQFDRAVTCLDRALDYLNNQIETENRKDIRVLLAEALFHMGQVRLVMGDTGAAKANLTESERLLNRIVNTDGQVMYVTLHAAVCLINALVHQVSGDTGIADELRDGAVRIWSEILTTDNLESLQQFYTETCQPLFSDLDKGVNPDLTNLIRSAFSGIMNQLLPGGMPFSAGFPESVNP